MATKFKVTVADLHPTSIVARLRALPRWQIVGAACVIAAVGSSMAFGLTRYTTHARQFCLSCHRYQRVDFEGQSNLHPEAVVCVDCHREGHSILPTQFSADSGNVRVQCVHCHGDIVTDEQRDYKYNVHQIRITHAAHLERPGVTCATCHYNVAHDRRDRPTNRPTMDDCFRCHEAEKHECTTCHPAGTLRTPENGPSVEANSCAVCHLDWETRTHDVKGARFRHGPHLAGELLCEQCHSQEEEHGQLALSEGNCSQECHQIQPASHKNGWLKRHGPDFEARARDCGGCHETDFCRRCHGVEMPHPQDWRGRHGRPALLDEQTCVRCHQSEFCADCHRTAKPATHVADWVRNHGQKQLTECAQCHAQSFCSGCHDRARPASHTSDWVEEHPAAARPAAEMCATCHRRDFCTSCHGGIELPHRSDWMLEHKGQASFARGSVCYRCHEYSETCALCHGEQPADSQ